MALAEPLKTGWFAIEGVQDGPRTLAEQMKGLDAALAEAPGASVLDLGCAEALISREFAKAGGTVRAVDYKEEFVEVARELCAGLSVRVECGDVSEMVSPRRVRACRDRYDIVLALAILHKLPNPEHGVEYVAKVCSRLAVIRLPIGADDGVIYGKQTRQRCDIGRVMRARGFKLERKVAGPRGELVQYWRKC